MCSYHKKINYLSLVISKFFFTVYTLVLKYGKMHYSNSGVFLWKCVQSYFYENVSKLTFMKMCPNLLLWKCVQIYFYENVSKFTVAKKTYLNELYHSGPKGL